MTHRRPDVSRKKKKTKRFINDKSCDAASEKKPTKDSVTFFFPSVFSDKESRRELNQELGLQQPINKIISNQLLKVLATNFVEMTSFLGKLKLW